MKKLFPLTLILMVALLSASCTKTYTCTCVVSGYGAKDSVLYYSYRGVSHNTASNDCNNAQANGNTTGYVFACHL